MAANAGILIGWTRAFPGKEAQAVQKFGEYVGYLTKLQSEKRIESFEPAIINPHGGDLNGFFIIRGDRNKLHELKGTDHWKDWLALGSFLLDGFGAQEIFLGEEFVGFMGRFQKLVNE